MLKELTTGLRRSYLCLIATCLLLISGSTAYGNMSNADTLERCPIPKIQTIWNVTTNSADIVWAASDSASTVDLEWRIQGEPIWNLEADIASPFTLTGLDACATYEVRLIGHCPGVDSQPSAVDSFEADGCCRIPTGLRLVSSTQMTATVAWDSVSFAFAHHVRYRAVNEEEWTEFKVKSNLAGLQDLVSCTQYEVQVGSQCDLDSTNYSGSLLFQTIDCGLCSELVYCDASGDDASTEWIDSVAFGSIRLKSGNNQGYMLRNTVQTHIERKRAYSFHVSPASNLPGSQFYLRMWMDLDQDGFFTDSTELLIDPEDPVGLAGWTQMIQVADSVQLGNTRMRISLKAIVGNDTLKQEACESFLFGEVEDYCIYIGDLCPEVIPQLLSVSETSATIGWGPVVEAITFIYRWKPAAGNFNEPVLTQDTLIIIGELEKCTEYIVETLSVCIQDTSSWQPFAFETECPDAVFDILPLADDLKVYPNPFSDYVSIEFTPLVSGKANIRLFSIVGRQLVSKELSLQKDVSEQIELVNLAALAQGIYLLILDNNERRQVLKLVK